MGTGGSQRDASLRSTQLNRLIYLSSRAYNLDPATVAAAAAAAAAAAGDGGDGCACCGGLVTCFLDVLRALGAEACLPAAFFNEGPTVSVLTTRQILLIRHRAAARVTSNGAIGAASLCTRRGNKRAHQPNQDSMIVLENFMSRADSMFCGVFDGHGENGHLVSQRVRDTLPANLCTCLQNTQGDGELPENFATIRNSLVNGFAVTDRDLNKNTCFFSGTTAVTAIKLGQDLIIANLGDSRAILGRRNENNGLYAIQLTEDMKPDVPNESARIKRCGGKIFADPRDPQVNRVWMPNARKPGLAMTRAFGDFCVKRYGVICVPEVLHHRITGRDEFIVLATDGIWDVLQNHEVVSIVQSAPRLNAARALVETAVVAWSLRRPTDGVDDIAVVCLFLDNNETVSSSASE